MLQLGYFGIISSMKYQILLYYQYTSIDDPQKFWEEHKALCEKLQLKGRIIVASEGLNGTVEGTVANTEKYIKELRTDLRFKSTDFKKSKGNGEAFTKLNIKLRSEIVSSYQGNYLDPKRVTGKYITPEELHELILSDKRFFIVDMRNDYEQAVGYFDNSLLAPFENFRDLPKVLPVLESLKDQTIVTVCTGGVRCEKASGFLVQNGFKDVYQLYGGIVSYMERYPNEDFLGSLYVFDGRVTMGFNLESSQHQIVGKCRNCQAPAEKYYDCKNIYCQGKRHFISCMDCIERSNGYCLDCLKMINNPLDLQFPGNL
jgi:UPF0176 protein